MPHNGGMYIGVLKEIKDKESRVAVTPSGAKALVKAGHAVLIEKGAGLGSGFRDDEYGTAGATLCDAKKAWAADLVVKVKEPLESEYQYLDRQIVFTYFHLAGVAASLTEALLERGTTAVAYETVEDHQGKLPLLAPMSAVAGDMATLMGVCYLAKFNSGKGMLLGKVLGETYGKVVIIGDGVVGRHAAAVATALGADVFLFGRHEDRAASLKREISGSLRFVLSTPENISQHLIDADLVVGAVLIRGAKAPYVVTETMVAAMQPGSVIVDVSIDQGGCVETARPTSHSDPVFVKHDVIHYCVTNMPGAYPRTSTMALTSATLPYVLRLADKGLEAFKDDRGFARGVNVHDRRITCKAVAEVLGMPESYRALTL